MDGFKSIRDLKLYNKSFFYFENFKNIMQILVMLLLTLVFLITCRDLF